ncbi:MAG: restriction endonuclease subunit S [Saprospiraceae bacterium]
MKSRLSDIVSISTGLYQKESPGGGACYLQARHFDAFGRFRDDGLPMPHIEAGERISNHLLREGDILLIAKGDSNRACLYDPHIGKAVASSTFFVLRLKTQLALPGYLHWLLNTSPLQSVLAGLARGTHTPSISKKALAALILDIPPLEIQREVLEVLDLWEKERVLASELIRQKEVFYENLLLHLANSKTSRHA